MNRCDRLQHDIFSSECALILLFSLEIRSSIEFDIFFFFFVLKKRTNILTSSGVHAVDSALVRINSAIHITSSFELLASILNLYILHHVSECHFLINIINNNKEFQKKKRKTYPKFAEILCLIITRELHRKTVSHTHHIHYISPSFHLSSPSAYSTSTSLILTMRISESSTGFFLDFLAGSDIYALRLDVGGSAGSFARVV